METKLKTADVWQYVHIIIDVQYIVIEKYQCFNNAFQIVYNDA